MCNFNGYNVLFGICRSKIHLQKQVVKGGKKSMKPKRPVPSEAQYRMMAMRFADLIYKEWFENGGKEKYEKEHPNWREEERK